MEPSATLSTFADKSSPQIGIGVGILFVNSAPFVWQNARSPRVPMIRAQRQTNNQSLRTFEGPPISEWTQLVSANIATQSIRDFSKHH